MRMLNKYLPSILVAIFLSFAPVSFMSYSGSVISQNAALACGSGEIEVGIPIFAGQNCIPNDQPGGAIFWYTKQLIKLASGAIVLIIFLMMLIGGVQYITASGDPGRVKAARTRITNAIIGLVLFLMAFAILNFLLPSGILTQ
jgi:hypothetical protein